MDHLRVELLLAFRKPSELLSPLYVTCKVQEGDTLPPGFLSDHLKLTAAHPRDLPWAKASARVVGLLQVHGDRAVC